MGILRFNPQDDVIRLWIVVADVKKEREEICKVIFDTGSTYVVIPPDMADTAASR